jgi:hypothetical protein
MNPAHPPKPTPHQPPLTSAGQAADARSNPYRRLIAADNATASSTPA